MVEDSAVDFTMRSSRSLSFCTALLSSAICLSLALSSLICMVSVHRRILCSKPAMTGRCLHAPVDHTHLQLVVISFLKLLFPVSLLCSSVFCLDTFLSLCILVC